MLSMLGSRGIAVSQTGHGTAFSLTTSDNIVGYFLGSIITTGPDGAEDWTDERYWVQPILFDLAGSDVGLYANLYFGPNPPPLDTNGNYTSPYPVTATNTAEIPPSGSSTSGTHLLEAGLPVICYAVTDQQSPPQIHWVFISAVGSGSLPTGQFVGQQYQVVANNQAGWRLERCVPSIPNS
jgi:hypothetical protein